MTGAVNVRASVLLLGLCATALEASAQVTAGSAVYVRGDTDHTTVVAPRLSLSAPVAGATRIDLVYTADVWTSASIDIRSSASKAVSEQRDEINAGLAHDLGDVRLVGSYRFSHEPDYESHGAVLALGLDLAQKSTTIDLRLAASFDQVGRAGDPGFARDARNLSARLSFTQLLDTDTFVQLVYEVISAHGYNSSPYRYIGIGTFDGRCRGAAFYCIPEANPSERLRHAFAVSARRALGERFALGMGYRFYLDDWAVRSHTAVGELSFSPTRQLMLSVRYRFYTQTAASQYRSAFSVSDSAREYYSNDKELSTFTAHRLAFEIERSFELERGALSLIASVAPSRFSYADYLPVRSIDALEVTLAARLSL